MVTRDAAHVVRGGGRVGYKCQRIVGVLIGDVGIVGGEDRDAGAVTGVGRGRIDQGRQIAKRVVGVLPRHCIVGEHDAGGLVVTPEVVEAFGLAVARQCSGFAVAPGGVFATVEQRHYKVGRVVAGRDIDEGRDVYLLSGLRDHRSGP